MRSNAERIALMHQRAEMLQKKKELARLRVWGGASAALFCCLAAFTALLSSFRHSLSMDSAAASSLLSDSVGGYVLTAVLAFMIGVAIAILIRNRRGKK